MPGGTVKASLGQHSSEDTFSSPAAKYFLWQIIKGEKKKRSRKDRHCSHDL